MQRKTDIEKIKLQIVKVEANNNCLRIHWDSTIGFGNYTLVFKEDGTIEADSENMDSNTDKDFLKKLTELLIEKIKVK